MSGKSTENLENNMKYGEFLKKQRKGSIRQDEYFNDVIFTVEETEHDMV